MLPPLHYLFIDVFGTGKGSTRGPFYEIQADGDAHGREQLVRGLGVVGRQPLLQPGESFRYTSGCRLRAASGTMHGRYLCVAEDGTAFDSAIPMFMLESTEDHGPPGHTLQNRTLH